MWQDVFKILRQNCFEPYVQSQNITIKKRKVEKKTSQFSDQQ